MKRIIAVLLILASLLSAVSCSNEAASGEDGGNMETAQTETAAEPSSVFLAENGELNFVIVRPDSAGNSDPETKAALALRRALEDKLGSSVKIATDWIDHGETLDSVADVAEILIGHTNRPETEAAIAELKSGEYIITVSENGKKIVVCGSDELTTERAMPGFLDMFVTGEGANLEIPLGTKIIGEADYSVSAVHGISYTQMGDDVLMAFNGEFYQRGKFRDAHFWDTCEILEAYIDAYEQTGSEQYLGYITNICKAMGARENTSWISNELKPVS